MDLKKPNFRIEDIIVSSSEAIILQNLSIQKKYNSLMDKTFCSCNPECECNPICNCEFTCNCNDHDNCNYCFCVGEYIDPCECNPQCWP
ncbi:MAG: hypothetical protein ACP5OG_05430 [Candidatus Nanoarchaeia archaeon]